MENRVIDALKNLKEKNKISIEEYKDLSPWVSKPGIMYVHKIVTLRPILSAIDPPTYKLAKVLVPILQTLKVNQ